MLSVIVRRSTLTIRSTIGISTNSPGPFGAGSSRPRRKMIPRSYSRATLIAEKRNRTTKKSRTATMMIAALMNGSYVVALAGGTSRFSQTPSTGPLRGRTLRVGSDRQHEAVQRLDTHALARAQLLAVCRACLPELAVHVDEAVPPDLADRTGDQLRADLDGSVAN